MLSHLEGRKLKKTLLIWCPPTSPAISVEHLSPYTTFQLSTGMYPPLWTSKSLFCPETPLETCCLYLSQFHFLWKFSMTLFCWAFSLSVPIIVLRSRQLVSCLLSPPYTTNPEGRALSCSSLYIRTIVSYPMCLLRACQLKSTEVTSLSWRLRWGFSFPSNHLVVFMKCIFKKPLTNWRSFLHFCWSYT